MEQKDVLDYSNLELLALIHALEHGRLVKSEESRTSSPMSDPYPPEYGDLITEAQRRNLCL